MSSQMSGRSVISRIRIGAGNIAQPLDPVIGPDLVIRRRKIRRIVETAERDRYTAPTVLPPEQPRTAIRAELTGSGIGSAIVPQLPLHEFELVQIEIGEGRQRRTALALA